MSKKNAILLILVVFLGSLGALIWFYFNGVNSTNVTIQEPTGDVYDPFGTGGQVALPIPTTDDTAATTTNELRGNLAHQISEEPIAGFSIFENGNEKLVRYTLRGNGNIYETSLDKFETRRLSNTTIPKIYETVWLDDAQHLILRYLKENNQTINSFSVKINPATSTTNEFEGGVDGNFLIDDLAFIAKNPTNNNQIFSGVKNLNGLSGVLSKPTGLDKKVIFESPLVEWAVTWPRENVITLNTKPSGLLEGYLYFLNPKTGDLTKVLGGITGLSSLVSTDGRSIIYSEESKGFPRLYSFNLQTRDNKFTTFQTLSEKCTWSKQKPTEIVYCAIPIRFEPGLYPDDWYKGKVSFSDNFWKINILTGEASEFYTPGSENLSFDAQNLAIDRFDKNLVFINKNDLTPWSLIIKQ